MPRAVEAESGQTRAEPELRLARIQANCRFDFWALPPACSSSSFFLCRSAAVNEMKSAISTPNEEQLKPAWYNYGR